ncbi:MAG: RimK family protein, partial [Gemmatimonadota bacterium]|nr:RimK family protein [Gemmatimonadota bacterium]
MRTIVVVENRKHWTHEISGVDVVTAKEYLTDPEFANLKRAGVHNLCRTYGFQGMGYYVSLLAAARGHRPLPSVRTIQALRQSPIVRILSDDLEEEMRRALHSLKTPRFEVSIYFGRNMAKKYDRLSRAIFNQFPAPFLRAIFEHDGDDWYLKAVRLIAANDIPDNHRRFVLTSAAEFFAKRPSVKKPKEYRYHMAILWSEDMIDPPSHEGAIKKFIRAARSFDIGAQVIGVDDYARIAEYDALFIRQTTAVDHHTFRFAERAAVEGLVVVDDPESIIRCTNKVYQTELFFRHSIPHPKTLVVHTGNVDAVISTTGLPCVLKAPDSYFSKGVTRVENEADLKKKLAELFKGSDLVVAQEYIPTEFDWRVGVLGGKALFACKYHM